MPKINIDITGERYGVLVAVERINDPNKPKGRCWKWKCKCDCGQTTEALANNLRSGLTKSCGCNQYAKEHYAGRGSTIQGCSTGVLTLSADEQQKVRDKIVANSHAEGDCILWDGTRDTQDYGYVCFGGKARRVTRVLIELHQGELLPKQIVMHTCDNPRCIRIDHLRVGTPAENTKDCRVKGRMKYGTSPGESNPNSKLTAAKVREIRIARNQGESLQSLAKRFQVTDSNIQAIVYRKTWRHVE